jgi:hypothetical protein
VEDSDSAQELLAKQVGTYDESELGKLLLEISLLDSAYQRFTASSDDVLMDAAKRYRVGTEKVQKAVAKEFAAKRDKKTVKSKARKTAAGVDPFLMFGGVLVWGLSSNGTENLHKGDQTWRPRSIKPRPGWR